MTFKKTILISIAWLTCSSIGGALAIFFGAHLYLSPSLPSVESLRDVRLQTPLRIYSSDGKLIGEIGEKRRTPVKFQDIPQAYIDALLSAEDAQFYSHNGVSIRGLMRAFSQILMSGAIRGGGSTITMQVARNYFLSKRQEFKRKFNEILLALRIERELSKQEILELYVNVIYLGSRAYGIHAAAQVYYGLPLKELNIAQLAMIAGLPKAPSTMNPIANPERALQRRNWILRRMLDLGKLNQLDYDSAIAEPITASYHGNNLDLNAPYIAEMARLKAVELFGTQAYTDGYRVYTTIDSKMQKYARDAVIAGLVSYDERHGYRGPERKTKIPKAVAMVLGDDHSQSSQSEAEADEEAATKPMPVAISPELKQQTIESWHKSLLAQLKDVPTYADIEPAAVVGVQEQAISVLTKSGKLVDLGWQQGLASARPYVSALARGKKPKTAADVVALGDIVRVRLDADEQYRLTQIPEAQAALVSLNPRNGAILALTGGLDFNHTNFNRATQAKRQPGSNFKPFIYTAALEAGYTPATVINDAPIVFDDAQLESAWRPENSGGNFYGPTRLRKALYMSRNLVSIRILRGIGIKTALREIARFGVNPDELPHDLSLALGSHVMTPLEVASGYAVLANGGYKIEPYFIERILNYEGDAVFEALPPTVCNQCSGSLEFLQTAPDEPPFNDPFEFKGDAFAISRELKAEMGGLEPEDYPRAPRVIDERIAYIMDSMLKDVVQRGTGVKAKSLKRKDLAGKTGTTNDATDAWFSGYGGDLVTTTWIGFDQLTTLGREYGSTAALPIWIDFMGKALQKRPEVNRPRPPGLVTVRINPDTGKRARAGEPGAIFEIFREETVPDFEQANDSQTTPWQEPQDVSTESIF